MIMSDEWRKAIEDKYIKDFQRLPRTRARRDRLFATWAAARLGRNDLDAYIEEVRRTSTLEAGDIALLRKVFNDLIRAGQNVDEANLAALLNEMMFEAAAQLAAET
jgi:hypothetical protein